MAANKNTISNLKSLLLPFLFLTLLNWGCQSALPEASQSVTAFITPSATLMRSPIPTDTSDITPITTLEIGTVTPTLMEPTLRESQTSTDSVAPTAINIGDDPTVSTIVVDQTATITLTPTKTIKPTRTPYPTLTRRPTRTPTITPTPTPPLAFFRINNLAMYSKVISPVRPESIVSPGEDGLIHVEIIGENQTTISNEVFNYRNMLGRHFLIAPEIDFEIKGVAENGRLQIASYDRFQRKMWLTSVDLILLSIGDNQITAPRDFTEPYIIRQPVENDQISGGMLEINGLARILNSTPLIIECINPQGTIICSDQVLLTASMEGVSHIPFNAYLPYQVSEATNIRLTFRQESNNNIAGTVSLSSFEIILNP